MASRAEIHVLDHEVDVAARDPRQARRRRVARSRRIAPSSVSRTSSAVRTASLSSMTRMRPAVHPPARARRWLFTQTVRVATAGDTCAARRAGSQRGRQADDPQHRTPADQIIELQPRKFERRAEPEAKQQRQHAARSTPTVVMSQFSTMK